MSGDPRGFEVWERRDVGSQWGPWSDWPREMLPMIEAGAMLLGGRWERER